MGYAREIKAGCCVLALLGAFAVPAASGSRQDAGDEPATEVSGPTGPSGTTGPASAGDPDDAEVRATAPRPAPSARGCREAGAGVTELAPAAMRRVLLCLVNVDRRSRDIPAVRTARLLERSAQNHSADMVRRGYFAHASPAGSTLKARVKRAGYLQGVRRWTLGETLAYGSRSVTLVELFARLIASPPHRAIIRERRFRELGVGVMPGMPRGRGAGLTVTMNFGTVSGRV